MAIHARLLRSFIPALVCSGLVLAACSSDSEEPGPGAMEPEPGEGGADSGNGNGQAGTDTAEAGSPPVTTGGTGGTGGTAPAGAGGEPEPGAGGTPTEPPPGAAGAGGAEEPGPVEPTPTFKNGEAIYLAKCVTCHGADRGGAGIYANISSDMENGIGAWTDEEIGAAIVEGKDPEGGNLCSFMVPFADMSESDVSDLIEYLRGAAPSNRKITAQCNL